MTITNEIANEIRGQMARRRVNQTQLAARLGMSQPALSRQLNGHTPMTVDFVERVAQELEVPVSTLLNLSGLTAISPEYAMLGAA
jgi:transcriptional regulator with XRE-family HTH domain